MSNYLIDRLYGGLLLIWWELHPNPFVVDNNTGEFVSVEAPKLVSSRFDAHCLERLRKDVIGRKILNSLTNVLHTLPKRGKTSSAII